MTSHQEKVTNALLDFFRTQADAREWPADVQIDKKSIETTDKLVALLAPERGDRARQIASQIAGYCMEQFVLADGVDQLNKQGLTDKFTSIILNESGSL